MEHKEITFQSITQTLYVIIKPDILFLLPNNNTIDFWSCKNNLEDEITRWKSMRRVNEWCMHVRYILLQYITRKWESFKENFTYYFHVRELAPRWILYWFTSECESMIYGKCCGESYVCRPSIYMYIRFTKSHATCLYLIIFDIWT